MNIAENGLQITKNITSIESCHIAFDKYKFRKSYLKSYLKQFLKPMSSSALLGISSSQDLNIAIGHINWVSNVILFFQPEFYSC